MVIAAMLLLATGIAVQGAGAPTRGAYRALICIANGPVQGLLRAELMAAQMFRAAGVELEWRRDLDPRVCPARSIQITVGQNTSPNVYPGVLAYAVPDGSKRIQVFFDRIEKFQLTQPTILLAHVLVHEITHILQGVSRHSETGVMKAQWETADYNNMTRKPLPFTPTDIELIRRGLERGAAPAAEVVTR